MSNSIRFKTEINISCQGFEGYCSKDIWVPGQIEMEEVLTIPQNLDTDYEHELYSARTSELEMPADWFGYGDEWWCVDCWRKAEKARNEAKNSRKPRKRSSSARK